MRGQFDGTFTAQREAIKVAPPRGRPAYMPAVGAHSYVHWRGIFKGFSGYAKANREVVLRLANTFRVSAELALDCPDHDEYLSGRLEFYSRVAIPPEAPSVRFFGPTVESDARKPRVIWTMMETERVHPNMVGLMNEHYHECWTPTEWNARAFKKSGLEIPVRAMPLGVDPLVYRPAPKSRLPEATLITTKRAGTVEVPEGFLFAYVFLPSWRKGADVILPAFEEAFAGDPEVGLVLCMTHSSLEEQVTDRHWPEMNSRVWVLKGSFTEKQMADLYRGCDAYVCSSRGEGWNLPAMEASACGLPAVLPSHTAHPELFGDHCLMYETDGLERCPDREAISPWYKDMPLAFMDKRTHRQLVRQLRRTVEDRHAVRARAMKFSALIRQRYTWDAAARQVGERLLELQG